MTSHLAIFVKVLCTNNSKDKIISVNYRLDSFTAGVKRYVFATVQPVIVLFKTSFHPFALLFLIHCQQFLA